MKKKNIELLVSESGSYCVSIILSTDKVAHYKNYEVIRKAIATAKEMIVQRGFPDKTRNILVERLDRLQKSSFEPFSHGLGIFVSETQMAKVAFPFQVSPRTVLSDSFETQDLLYLEQFLKPYYVLCLTRYAVRLYEGMMDSLEEVVNDSFPLKSEEDQENEPIYMGADSPHVKLLEKDKDIMAAVRIKAMFREADKRLEPSLNKNNVKLIIAGTQKIVSTYLKECPHRNKIIGHVKGSFNKKNFTLLKGESWEIFVKSERAGSEF
jgi:hypothetical protein